jgi:hypothetical protein
MKLIGVLLSLFCLVNASTSQIVVNDNKIIHYDTIYSNNNRFSNSLTKQSIIKVNRDNTTECKIWCAFNNKCVGIYENYDGDYYCNLLSKLGKIPKTVNETSNSIVKIIHYNYPIKNHSLNVNIKDTHSYDNRNTTDNITIYIDLNHNGVLDINEPNKTTISNTQISFDNIPTGTYLVRQLPPENCIQFYPGLNGSFTLGTDNIKGNGYIDAVIRYTHNGHSNYTYPFGGYVDLPNVTEKSSNFKFIIGDNDNTYMSFHPNDSITLAFLDESVLNTKGADIFFNIFKNSSTKANISVSNDDHEYVLLGVLNNGTSNNMFDLENINYNLQVNYVKLDFYGDSVEPLNIINAGVYNHSMYLPPFAYHISIPNKNTLFFINDCHYDYPCEYYCDFNLLSDYHYYSCTYGCDIFKKTNTCNCSYQLDYDDDYYNDFVIDKDTYCIKGCEYAVNKYIYPNYTLINNNIGFVKDIINNNNTCSVNCLDKLIDTCNLIDDCRALSVSGESNNIYNSYDHHSKPNNFFIMKNYFSESDTSSTTSSLTSTTSSLTSTTISLTSTTSSLTSTTSSLTSTTSSLTSTTSSLTSTTSSLTSTTSSLTSTTSSLTSTTSSLTSTTSSLTSTTSSLTSTTSSLTSTTSSLTSTTSSLTSTTSSLTRCNGNNTNCSVAKSFSKQKGLNPGTKNVLITIASICGISLLVIIIIITINRKNNRSLVRHSNLSITNPLYGQMGDLYPDPNKPTELYQDVSENHNPELYTDVDINHNSELNLVPEYNAYIEVLESDA